MALPREITDGIVELETYQADIDSVQTAIDALPATPLEADLPDIVAIIASLKTVTENMNSTLKTALSVINKVRINQ